MNFTKGLYILRDFKKFTSKAVPNITVAIGSTRELMPSEILHTDSTDYLLGGSGDYCTICANVNGDDEVNIADATALIDMLLSSQ